MTSKIKKEMKFSIKKDLKESYEFYLLNQRMSVNKKVK